MPANPPADWPTAPPGRRPDVIPFDEPGDDGPTVRLGDVPQQQPKRKPSRGRKAVVFAVLLALFAMGAAGYAVWLGRRALDRVAALSPAVPATTPGVAPASAPGTSGGSGQPAASSTPESAATGDATVLIDPSPEASPSPSASATGIAAAPPAGTVRYSGKNLPVRAGCATALYLDLDEPRAVPAGNTGAADVQTACAGTGAVLRLGPGAGGGAVIRRSAAEPGAAPTAATCEERLLSDPLLPDSAVPLRDGGALCVRTGPQGSPGTVVLLQVRSANGELALRATSWASAGG